MTWEELIHDVARRGLTLIFEPAYFMDGISGVKVRMAGFDPDEDLDTIDTIVRVDDFDKPGDAILKAAIELYEQLV